MDGRRRAHARESAGESADVDYARYKVVWIVFDGAAAGGVEDFITGWRVGDRVWGRLVDVVSGADGALHVSGDHGGSVYRVSADW